MTDVESKITTRADAYARARARARTSARWIACSALWLLGAVVAAGSAPVLMISVDGMKPEYVLEADRRGLKIPYLRSLLAQGSFAEGVVGVWPTVTYPSHTTLVTGVSPAVHGIVNNAEFDPERRFKESWYWYAREIRVPTLWHAARANGLATASIGWPVSVGAADVDFLIPEYWRISGPTADLNPSDRFLIDALSRPENLPEQMRDSAGLYLMGNDTSLHGDEIKTRFAIEILGKHKPALMTLHLSSLDDAEHAHGPFSKEADQTLEAIDALLAALAAAANAADPASVVAIVSDHGFTALTHRVNLAVAFAQAGLMAVAEDPETKSPRITSWKAQPWSAGGMAAIVLHDPGDRSTERAVGDLLRQLAAEPANGIAAVRSGSELKALGAFPDAAFLVVMRLGYYAGTSLSGEQVTAIPAGHGGHGFAPTEPEMRAAFFIAGRGIAAHRDLGVIDMRQIAPSLAAILGVAMPGAEGAPLRLSR